MQGNDNAGNGKGCPENYGAAVGAARDFAGATAKLHQHPPNIHLGEREESGRKLTYLKGGYAFQAANEIFGTFGWEREVIDIRLVAQDTETTESRDGTKYDRFKVGYVCHVVVAALGVKRHGVGGGSGIDRDLFRAHESAVKEAETDAYKRALASFGNALGLGLYTRETQDEKASEKKQQQQKKAAPSTAKQTDATTTSGGAHGAITKARMDNAASIVKDSGMQIPDEFQAFRKKCEEHSVPWYEVVLQTHDAGLEVTAASLAKTLATLSSSAKGVVIK